MAIRYGIQVLGGIVMLFVISAKLSLLIVLCLPLLVIFSIFLAKKLKNYSYQIQELQGSSGNTTEEAIKGFKTIKIFQALGKIEQIFAKRIDAIYESTVARSKLSAFFQSFVSLLLYSFIICFLAYGLYLAESGIINYSELSSFIMYAVLVAVSFSLLSSIIDDLSKAAGAYHRIGSLLNEERYDHQTIASIPEINSKLIEIEDLSFSYEDQLVLNNLNFNLQTNSLNIITGANGSGKTTFLNILLGFENNFTGDIKINDLSIRKTNLNGYFSLVAQETLILDLSVRENISLLNNKVNDQIIIEMLKELGGDFTSELPEGLDTACGNNGSNLSGGQKQLIALVRAMSSDAPIIVLDEATSALDTQRQAAVISKLKSLAKQGKTIIMISHKLEVIKNADNLVIFENDGSVQANRYEMLQDHSRYLNQMIRTN